MKLATLLGLVLLAASAQAGVLVVDVDGGAPFTSIQTAIDAAAPGDVVFVHGGNYYAGGFVIDGKPLTIIGESGEKYGESPKLTGGAVVRNVAAGTVKLDGLHWQGGPIPFGTVTHPSLVVVDCDASVRISDCVIGGFTSNPGTLPAGAPGLRVVRSQDVVVIESQLTGAAGWKLQPQAPAGGPGLHAIDSRVSLWSCDLAGGLGGGDYNLPGMAAGAGGPAALLQNSLLMVMACPVTGGQGGNSGAGAGPGGSGGVGVSGDAGSTAWLRWSSVGGGLGGSSPTSGFGPVGPQFAGDVDVITISTPFNSFIDTPNQLVESGQAFDLWLGLAFGGVLGVSLEGGLQPLPGWQGPLTLGPGATYMYFGVTLGFQPVVAPTLPSGFDELQVHLQAIGNDHTIGWPMVLTIVNDLP